MYLKLLFYLNFFYYKLQKKKNQMLPVKYYSLHYYIKYIYIHLFHVNL